MHKPVADTYVGERPSLFLSPFLPFELVHYCIERYLCVAQVSCTCSTSVPCWLTLIPCWWTSCLLRLVTYVHTFALTWRGLKRRRERLCILRSVLLYTAGLVTGSPVTSVRISVRCLDGSMALAWIFERPEHVCSHYPTRSQDLVPRLLLRSGGFKGSRIPLGPSTLNIGLIFPSTN
jgi:hypothetical protein